MSKRRSVGNIVFLLYNKTYKMLILRYQSEEHFSCTRNCGDENCIEWNNLDELNDNNEIVTINKGMHETECLMLDKFDLSSDILINILK